jgi:asparagine synthase (glutamine-hydrolysing)
MTQDAATYLPDDVLAKVDRASMSVSLESRAPLLDHRVAEFAAQLPDALLSDERGGKRPLRELLYRYVPRALVDRPKQGFCLPIGRWLRHELRDWAYSVFEPDAGGPAVLDLAACRRLLDEHMTGVDDASPQLWAAITFQAWLATSGAAERPATASPDATHRPERSRLLAK